MTDLTPDRKVERSQYGDSAIMLTVVAADGLLRSATTRALRQQVLGADLAGLTDIVAGLDSILVQYDCALVDARDVDAALTAVVEDALMHSAEDDPGREFVIPLVFGGDFGPDLDSAAEELGIATDELISRFTAHSHFVELLGSGTAPMMRAPSLGGPLSRRRTPRSAVPGGAVMAAGTNSIIGPAPGPSGWQILGRTPLALFDIHRDPVVAYSPGDHFTFFEITHERWAEYDGLPLEPRMAAS